MFFENGNNSVILLRRQRAAASRQAQALLEEVGVSVNSDHPDRIGRAWTLWWQQTWGDSIVPIFTEEGMEESRANKRATNWTDSEVLALIGVWRDNLEGLRAQRRNSHVYVKMQNELKEAGVQRSPADIKVKLKNLSRDYRKEKIKLGSGSSPSSWKFYCLIHELLGFLPVNHDRIMQENATLEIMTQDVEEKVAITDFEREPPEESEIPPCSTPSFGLDSGNDSSSLEYCNASSIEKSRSRKRKPRSENERNQIMQEMLEESKRHNKAEEIDRKFVALMERQAEAQDKMMQILGQMTDILHKAVQ